MEFEQLQRAIEAILFAAGEPVETLRLAHALETDLNEVVRAADALADAYAFERRGIRIIRLDFQSLMSLKMTSHTHRHMTQLHIPFSAG